MRTGAGDPGDVGTAAEATSRGRPRDPQVDQRILLAALSVLRAEGYDGMTMDAVAAAASVTKPTIYRRWRSKEDLATAAVATLSSDEAPETVGDPWQLLIGELDSFRRAVSRPNGMSLIGTLLAEESRTPELIRLFRERVVAQRRARVHAALVRIRDSGGLERSADLQLLTNMLIGAFYASYIGGETVADDWPARCVELLRPPGRRGRTPGKRPR